MLGQLNLNKQNYEFRSFPHIILKYQLKMDHKSKCKSYSYKTCTRKHRRKSLWISFNKVFLHTTPKAWSIKEKNWLIGFHQKTPLRKEIFKYQLGENIHISNEALISGLFLKEKKIKHSYNSEIEMQTTN